MNYDNISYPAMVALLSKPGQDIKNSLTPDECELLHMAIGVAGEAGELLDAFKKAYIYRKPLDLKNIKEELGDLEFFMERIRQMLGISREQTLEENKYKLMGKRYPNGYTDATAQARADKEPGQ